MELKNTMKKIIFFIALALVNSNPQSSMISAAAEMIPPQAYHGVFTALGSIVCGMEKIRGAENGGYQTKLLQLLTGYLALWYSATVHEFGHCLAAKTLWNCKNHVSLGADFNKPLGSLKITEGLSVTLRSLCPTGGQCQITGLAHSHLIKERLCNILYYLAGPLSGVCAEICTTYLINKLLHYLDRPEHISISTLNIASQLMNLLPLKGYDGWHIFNTLRGNVH